MSELIVRTPEQERAFLEQFADILFQKFTREQSALKTKHVDPKYIPYKLNSKQVKEAFPDTSLSTLRKWATDGIIGKKGKDGKYYVTINEVEKVLFGKK